MTREEVVSALRIEVKDFYENNGNELGDDSVVVNITTIENALSQLEGQGAETAIPIDWLMRYAQLPTEYAIAAWQKPKRETWIKQIRSRDKPMSFDDALQLVNDQK